MKIVAELFLLSHFYESLISFIIREKENKELDVLWIKIVIGLSIKFFCVLHLLPKDPRFQQCLNYFSSVIAIFWKNFLHKKYLS